MLVAVGSLQSADGRTALHHVAARSGQDGGKINDIELATSLLLLGCDPSTLDNYGRTAADIAKQHRQLELEDLLTPHEFKKQMAVIRAHFLGRPGHESATLGEAAKFNKPTPDILLKRACTSKQDVHHQEDKHHACIRFLFSTLAHGNQARNFKRVVCFLYA